MATWTNISNEDIKHKKPITVAAGRALRDNPIAMFEGAAGAPRLLDAALGGTVTGAGALWVGARAAGGVWNAIGQDVTAMIDIAGIEGPTTIGPATVVLGSLLSVTSASGATGGITLPGSWRCKGRIANRGPGSLGPDRTTTWQRVL